MIALLYILLILNCLLLAYEDLKSRFISVWALVVLAILLPIYSFLTEYQWTIEDILGNVVFIFLNLVALTLYLSFKHLKIILPTNGYFGLGDISFLIALAFSFQNIHFMIFTITSFMWGILYYICLSQMTKNRPSIPFAGLSALWLTIYLKLLPKIEEAIPVFIEIQNDIQ